MTSVTAPNTFHDLSIQADLEKLTPKYGATELISLLLKNYAIEMKESRRHLLSSSVVLARSKRAFREIELLISKVDAGAATNFAAVWTDFDNYTEAIPILERILFDFYLKVPKGLNHTAKTHLPPSDVTDGFIFIESWIADRQAIVDSFATLSGSLSKFLPDIANDLTAQWMTERRNDDLATLKAIHERIKALNPKDRWITQNRSSMFISTTITSYQKIYNDMLAQPPQPDGWVGLNMGIMTLILVLFEILNPSTSHKDKALVRSSDLWIKIKELLVAVEFGNRTIDPTPEILARWEALKKIFISLGGSVSLVEDLLALVQKAARVRRPFHGRSVRLIQMIRVLEVHIAEQPNSADERVVLKLIKDALPLLIDAEKAVTDVRQYRLDSEEYQVMASQFHAMVTQIGSCYKDFELEGQWKDQLRKYEDVVKTIDERHLTDFLARLSIA